MATKTDETYKKIHQTPKDKNSDECHYTVESEVFSIGTLAYIIGFDYEIADYIDQEKEKGNSEQERYYYCS